jgi:hypothetical protein
MSLQFGVKIKNIEASTLYECNIGVRQYYSFKPAMFTNSLFCDFLKENGLKIKNSSTRDIICLEFNFGTRSYEEEIAHLDKMILNEQDEEKKEFYCSLKERAQTNKDKYIKLTKEQVREKFYQDGVNVTYETFGKNGEVTKTETLHYKMLYRSTGKAKKGSCMFIVDRLYKKSINYLRMGIKLPKNNAPIVEISAYAPLTSSTIVGKVKIDPSEILVIKDIDSYFKTNVVSIETNENRECIAREIQDYELKNTMFDGQGLIDESVFPKWGNGYVLLRHHFCKMACFRTDIQQFFKDYFGHDYDTAIVTDMWGNEHLAKDIKLITTENAMKWVKFDITFDYWAEWVRANGSQFGIVKTAHESKLGDVQRMSYQMVNALDMDIMPNVVDKSVKYIERLKSNDDVFLDYLIKNANFFNDYEPLYELVKQDREFLRCEYFRERKYAIIKNYVDDFRRGRIIQNADNLVIVGSPYAMLLASVGEDVSKDATFESHEDCIECFTNRFANGEYLAEFRSPFNGFYNLGCLYNNKTSDIWNKYFYNLGNLIVAVNMQHTDFQDRNNGSDMDSDSIFVTNQKEIAEYAKVCYKKYPTIVNNIPKDKNKYKNTLEYFAYMDNNLARAQLAIGESSNLAQIALTYSHNYDDQKYKDAICILSVLAQVAIDNAKRQFDIDLMDEIKRLKKDLKVQEVGYPSFWLLIHPDFNRENINWGLKCPMNYMRELDLIRFRTDTSTLPISHFFIKHPVANKNDKRKCRKVEEFIQQYAKELYNFNTSSDRDWHDPSDVYLIEDGFNEMIESIRKIYISKNYIELYSWLIDRTFNITVRVSCQKNKSTLNKNRSILLKTLYDINKNNLLQCFKNG